MRQKLCFTVAPTTAKDEELTWHSFHCFLAGTEERRRLSIVRHFLSVSCISGEPSNHHVEISLYLLINRSQ